MSATSAPGSAAIVEHVSMVQLLLHACFPADATTHPATAERIVDALRTGGDLADIMLCLPGETDAVAALRFARTAADWWDSRLTLHERVISAVG